jgi:hypothetical protein
MTNKVDDTRSLIDSLTDYANEHGDQELISTMKVWLLQKMGKQYEINFGMLSSNVNLLAGLSHECLELSNKVDYKDAAENLGYCKAIGDVMDLIILKINKA